MNKYGVQIKLASPEDIAKWSNGVVEDNDTLNYRTLKPEEGGLFCAKIFGPVNNYECLCGKYKGAHYEDIVCQKCGVKVANHIVRRENMGHIQLPVKVVHKWFFRTTNNKIAMLLDFPTKELKRLVNLERYLVFSPGSSDFKEKEFISDMAYDNYISDNIHDDKFIAETGAEALHRLLSEINLEQKITTLKEQIKNTSSIIAAKKYHNILSLCEDMLKSNVRPEWMILDKIPVLPVDLRPLEELSSGQLVSADINDLYKTIIYRSNRLSHLLKMGIPIPLILHNDIRILQNAVNRLLYSETTLQKESDQHKRSIEDRLKGKTGLMRSLLGKRVDFSARTVIVIASFLKLDEVILPKEIMLELLTPALIGYLRTYGLANTTKQAKAIIDRREEIWDIVKEMIETRFPVVLLNRAPTLHRVSIMAFKVKLWDNKAIGLHPLVCSAFNADFDGDQMAIHLPLSEESKTEALMLMMPSKNFGSVARTGLIVGAPKDIGFGLYALTSANDSYVGKKLGFGCLREIEFKLISNEPELTENEKFTVNSPIFYHENRKKYDTTVGRVIFWNIIPKCSLTFDQINLGITSKMAQNIMSIVLNDCGPDVLTKFVDDVKDLGFKYSDFFNGSFGLLDLFRVDGLDKLIDDSLKKQIGYHLQMEEGFITQNEMRNRSIELWGSITHKGNEMIRAELNKVAVDQNSPCNGSVAKIIKSGARGSIEQLSQMLFMKGTIVGIDGKISIYPIWTGFKNGLTMYHYFQASRGSRRACTDVALKTAEAGYLTRRLVDIAHGSIINMEDCETEEHLILKNVFKDCKLHSLVFDRILGRVCAKDIILNEEIIVKRNELITSEIVKKLRYYDITEVPVRSSALCSNIHGVCAMCYGSDISTGSLVNLGEAVGVIAAQSIGEPATQLNMRAYHFGGIANIGSIETAAITPFSGRVQFVNSKFLDVNSKKVNISRDMKIIVLNNNNMILAEFQIPYGAHISVNEGDIVPEQCNLASWKPDIPIIAEFRSKCKFVNVVLGVNSETVIDEATGAKSISIIKHSLSAFIYLTTENGTEVHYYLPEGTLLNVDNNEEVEPGTIIGYTKHKITNINIVGGLQSVVNILENREPKHQALLSHIDGEVSIMKNKIIIQNSLERKEYALKDQGLVVQQGEMVKKGQRLTTGSFVMQDLLDTHGINEVIAILCFELLNIYTQQGISVDSKHLEIIVRQMCCFHEIIDRGDSELLEGQTLHTAELYKYNRKLEEENKNIIKTKIIIQGITDAALNSESFLSSASFQETINVLVEAGLRGKIDPLLGLKENIIAGTLIPAGTGFAQKVFESMVTTVS